MPKNWQFQLGFWGSLAWISLISNLDTNFIRSLGEEVNTSIAGYVLGFVTAFSGFMFWKFVHGEGLKIYSSDEHFIFKISSIITFMTFALFGLFGLYTNIFMPMPWYYLFAFSIATIVVSQGVIPIINFYDK